ncbi:MAG: LysM peptidoglycan-binding domain-containing protein [Verrucomicrobia bacterium]|nr:LysM peptidoglycan-binding domain-containing protein [Verrucomicrobiota bacterium]
MSTPSPLVPQGTQGQKPRVQSNIRIAVFTILAIHAVLFAGLLMQGCKPEPTKTAQNEAAPFDPALFAKDGTAAVTPAPAGDARGVVAPPPLPVGVSVTAAPTTAAGIPTPPPLPGATTSGLPTPGAPEMPTTGLGATEHVVAKGEMIATIAKKYGVTSSAVLAANPGVDPKKLKISQKLIIPAPQPKTEKATASLASAAPSTDGANIYVVKSNDNLTKIAKQFGTSISEIRKANALKTDRLSVNQKLKIPTKVAAAPEAPAATGTPGPAALAAPGRVTWVGHTVRAPPFVAVRASGARRDGRRDLLTTPTAEIQSP